jgi:DNA-binding MarR family transcriptional regulator
MLVILEKKGYVTLHSLPEDKKSLRASLTLKCNDYLQVVNQSGNELLEKIFANVNDDKLQSILEAFETILENIDVMLNTKNYDEEEKDNDNKRKN